MIRPIQFESLLPPKPAIDLESFVLDVRLRASVASERPFTFANMITSLDGVTAIEGSSKPLGSSADKEHLRALRMISDAVLVGPETLRAEKYGRLIADADRREVRVQQGLSPDPLAVVISRSFRIAWDVPLFGSADQTVVVYTTQKRTVASVSATVKVVELADVSPAAVLADLYKNWGVKALLVEGGPTILRSLIEAKQVDELFITVAPLLAGSSADSIPLVPSGTLTASAKLELQSVLKKDSELFLRYRFSHNECPNA